jgi:geranylgeranyl diphosphate synthase type II
MFDIETYLEEGRALIDRALDDRLPAEDTPPEELHKAMRYSVFAGGKRLRPILCLAAARALGAAPEVAMIPAMAVEILHTYSLIHDDLPAMDDDDLRHGKPTSHVVFGEANAILAGDALLTFAFELLAACPAPPPYPPTELVRGLARAAGASGMIAGQFEDMASEGKTPDAELVDYIHRHKTASLIRAAVHMGAIAGGATSAELEALCGYGICVGLAFQVTDDILNETATPEQLGKPAGSDREREKMTYVAVYGLDEARGKADDLMHGAIASLKNLPGDIEPLEAIARYVVERKH